MRPEDFAYIVPYGLVVGGHVTPIDHQYFAPQDPRSPLDAYDVRAMADSRLVDIQPRTFASGPKKVEYRLVFSLSCKLFYYYDLVTSLAGRAKDAYERTGRAVNLDVKEGELIGRIGGQTLDFAVWDMDVVLPGLLVRGHYDNAEPWKVHTADPLDYYTDDLRSLLLSRYVRTAEPISGKIDYDQDGRLVGNWFVEGTNGYLGAAGQFGEGYWKGHLSVAPNNYDPAHFIISLGDFGGEARQFAARDDAPRPDDVSVGSGLVKYELVGFVYLKSDGTRWDQRTLTKGPRLAETTSVAGCFAVQLIETRRLRAESFPGKGCAQVAGLSPAAKTYER